MKRFVGALLLTVVAIPIVIAAAAQSQTTYRVVVHPENPAVSASDAEITHWMLKKVVRWPDGVKVDPVDLVPNSPVRAAFSTAVLSRDVRSVVRYWQRQVFSARSLPPPELTNDEAVIDFVRRNRGGIGYVSGSADLSGVKQLRVTSQRGGEG